MRPTLEQRIQGIEDYMEIRINGYDLNGNPEYVPRVPPPCSTERW